MSTYLILTPVQGTTVTGQRLTTWRYIEDIWAMVVHYSEVTLAKMEIFANSEWYNALDLVDYFVVRFVFLTQDKLKDWKGAENEDTLLNIINTTHHKVLISGIHYDKFYSEMAIYEFVSAESSQIKIKDPSSMSSVTDTLIRFQEKTDHAKAYCQDSYIRPLQKIHVCAFITINMNDLSIGRALGIPNLANMAFNNTYFTFDYEIKNENISLCLTDFITLYDILSEPTYDNDNSNICHLCNLLLLVWIALYALFGV